MSELHTYGSVRNLKDRRSDLYDVKLKRSYSAEDEDEDLKQDR